MSDSLLKKVSAGDMGAMQACIDEYSGLIWSLARRLCPTTEEAEDAVQEVFIALWENASRFDREKGAEVTFVAMIARRRLIDRMRKRQRQRRLLEDAPVDQVAAARPDEVAADTTDESSRAMRAMGELSAEQQRVLRLAIHFGRTHEQIAEQTGLPLGTVKTHARRGLIRVGELLRETETDSPVGSN